MRLLIIEDDRESADYLVKAFREVGHIADLAGDGEEGLSLAQSGDYDVLVVDRMLPKRDGLSLIGSLREKGNRTPVLILSALGQVDDRIKGLRAGGDDYLPKPYAFAELLARVEVLSRRHGGPAEETTYKVGDLELDRLSHRVARGKDELTLQPREFRPRSEEHTSELQSHRDLHSFPTRRSSDLLRAGGDDYLPKPYAFAELLARVEVLSRRHGGPAEETTYKVGDLELDRLSHRVARGKDELTLQPREFRLLEYLMKHAGQVVTRTMLLENVWDYHFDPQTNVIDVHISRLRSKIDKGFAQPLLHTVRGAGYMVREGK